jgi:predicted phosphodiesterase
MLKQFDLISDLHIDKWVGGHLSKDGQLLALEAYVKLILTDTPSKILVIAGDMGHSNTQNFEVLYALSKVYDHIVIVRGNHDLYLVGYHTRRYFACSEDRWSEMKDLTSLLPSVHFLEGDTVTLDNVTFGGTGMWYDFQYGIQELNLSVEVVQSIWESTMNDGNYIRGIPRFEDEFHKLERLLENPPDVIVTHVGPHWRNMREGYAKGVKKSFYSFDGRKLLNKVDGRGRVWCFGHIHEHYSYKYNGWHLVNNTMGYPKNDLKTKIRRVTF